MNSDNNEARPRVGFLTTELGAGGAEKVVFDLASRLDRNRFNVVGVWCLGPAEGFYAGELGRVGLPCHGAGARSFLDTPWALWSLRGSVRAARLDLLNAHLFHASMAARLVARRAGVGKLVVSHHFHEARSWRFRAERFLLGRAAATTAVSKTVAEHVAAGLGIPPGTVTVIHNGVDTAGIAAGVSSARAETRRRLRVPDEVRLIGTVGRLAAEKDPLTLLESFAQLAREDDSLRLVYVGDGPLHESVFKRIGALGLRERASIIGFWANVPAVLSALDLFAMTSVTEGHPLALLEAMAAGLPVAASRIPAVEEVVGPAGGGALLCAPRAPAEFAAAMRKLLDDKDLAASGGAMGRDLVRRRFSSEQMFAGYEGLFAELLELPPAEAEPDREPGGSGGRRNGLTAPRNKL